MTRTAELLAMMLEYQADPEDYDEGEEEDPRPYLNGESELERFACVTVNYSSHGYEKPFFLFFPERDAAELRAMEYVQDDIFEEIPVEVRDLDTGEKWMPDWSSLKWAKK